MKTNNTDFSRSTPKLLSLLTSEQTADYLNISTATLNKWRCEGRIKLPYKKVGRCVRYRLSDVEVYLEQHTMTSPNTTLISTGKHHDE
ncbi:MAG: helix-turn-helix domain-containing protein [Piscirickettsiaceae bacterium]|nr:helix-turn-helix domain-containing protein [Piscirickettsiaceae bacterium]